MPVRRCRSLPHGFTQRPDRPFRSDTALHTSGFREVNEWQPCPWRVVAAKVQLPWPEVLTALRLSKLAAKVAGDITGVRGLLLKGTAP